MIGESETVISIVGKEFERVFGYMALSWANGSPKRVGSARCSIHALPGVGGLQASIPTCFGIGI